MSIESVMLSSHLILCHPLLLCLQSVPASGLFPMGWLLALSDQSIGASASVFPMNIQGWSSCCPRDSQESSPAPQFKSISSSERSRFYGPALSSVHDYWKNQLGLMQTFVGKVMSLLFNTLSRFVIAFLPRSRCLLISGLQSPSAVILEPKKIKMCYCFHFFTIYFPWSDGTRCHGLHF